MTPIRPLQTKLPERLAVVTTGRKICCAGADGDEQREDGKSHRRPLFYAPARHSLEVMLIRNGATMIMPSAWLAYQVPCADRERVHPVERSERRDAGDDAAGDGVTAVHDDNKKSSPRFLKDDRLVVFIAEQRQQQIQSVTATSVEVCYRQDCSHRWAGVVAIIAARASQVSHAAISSSSFLMLRTWTEQGTSG